MKGQSSDANEDNVHNSEQEDSIETEEVSNCPICTNQISNRALTDTCIHEFCLDCITEWSANHSNCPVCRQNYRYIICNIISDQVFQQIPVRQPIGSNWRLEPIAGAGSIEMAADLIDSLIVNAVNQELGSTAVGAQVGGGVAQVSQVMANIDFNQVFKYLIESVTQTVIQRVIPPDSHPIQATIDVNGNIDLTVRLVQNVDNTSASDHSNVVHSAPGGEQEDTDASNENQNPNRSTDENRNDYNSDDFPLD